MKIYKSKTDYAHVECTKSVNIAINKYLQEKSPGLKKRYFVNDLLLEGLRNRGIV